MLIPKGRFPAARLCMRPSYLINYLPIFAQRVTSVSSCIQSLNLSYTGVLTAFTFKLRKVFISSK